MGQIMGRVPFGEQAHKGCFAGPTLAALRKDHSADRVALGYFTYFRMCGCCHDYHFSFGLSVNGLSGS
jgi:hypothetical protein